MLVGITSHSVALTLLELLERQHCTYACLTVADDSRLEENLKGNMKVIRDHLLNYKWSTVVGTADPQNENNIDRVLDYVWKLGNVARSQQYQDGERVSLFPWL